ncbi:amino acid ABC transporter permease [Tessaracoccus lapidicaptus]|uniref:Amino acid ABC transporter permease n=1 Tax=Tessaracoccus lapidicaptus TaxID=1427523 RepID=A0A1C0AN39_9ACTN|nr:MULTISPECIES: amino acid ABC transporter permease [Tessaracoccus]AQX14631.1 amino acid ABC transporter permease [Tessaracoccus sp. T2.5-30]OCL34713.1 amino acid ABC transporter permease [Tessaracoccus lapidicaptus]VEP38681.1 putative glutamine ABC transporter permease protein GlnP [Tessaracoccus lapidicaptus]
MTQLWSLMPEFWGGLRMTVLLLAVSGGLSLVLGTVITALRISPVPVLRWFAAIWTEVARNTPLTLVFFFTAFVLPMLGVRAPFLLLALVALTYYTSPFVAEALRSGINGVPVGQAEAARSIGLGFGQTVTLVVLPQAFRMTIPPLINVYIALTKNTSVAGGFFVVEMFATTRQLVNDNGNIVLPLLLVAAALYLVVTVPLGFAAVQLEKRWVVSR